MGHFPGIACWRHTSGVTASSSLNIIMIRLALTLVSLVATIYAQDAPETPLWFLETSLDGPFRERSAACPPLPRQDKMKPPLDPSSSPRIKRLESVSDSPPEMVDPRPGDTTLDPEEPAPTSAVSSSLPQEPPSPRQATHMVRDQRQQLLQH